MALHKHLLGLSTHLAAVALLQSALLVPPSTLSHTKLALAFLPLIWSCNIYSWSVGLGFLAAIQAMWATELLLFQAPREQFMLIHRVNPGYRSSKSKAKMERNVKKQEDTAQDETKEQSLIWKEPYPATIWKRFCWVFKLHISMRYVGWDTGDGKMIERMNRAEKSHSRVWWLLKNIVFVGICFSIYDMTNFYQHFDPYFQVETDIDEALPRRLMSVFMRYHLGFLPPRLLRILVLGVQPYVIFALIHNTMAVVHVTMGGIGILGDFWGGVENWPPLMGSPVVILTRGLRGFWGEFWHQLFRTVGPPSKADIR
jgi:hypothetical protein